MKRNHILILYFTILIGLLGCSDNENLSKLLENLEPKAQTALELINDFRTQVTPEGVSRASSSDLKIFSCKKEDVL